MTISWGSLYLPSVENALIATALRDSLSALGYQSYDPFGMIPGKSYPRTVRTFVTPPLDGWVRVIGAVDKRALPMLSSLSLCLNLSLDRDSAEILTYVNGEQIAPQLSLEPYLRRSASDLASALNGDNLPQAKEHSASPFDNLPNDVQALSAEVDPRQAQKMFDRISGTLMKKVGGGEMAGAAQDLISGSTPDWNSEGGRRIRAVMSCLTIPANWRQPDFSTLRDAYQLHARRQRNSNARMYPGDEETMKQVPDALTCIPVYGGMSE